MDNSVFMPSSATPPQSTEGNTRIRYDFGIVIRAVPTSVYQANDVSTEENGECLIRMV
jgi:hypothetical protein